MAGGCEEVVAVGDGIRTGARTGVELDKHNEADGATEDKILAGGAAAEQCSKLFQYQPNTYQSKKSSQRLQENT
jgi:hypothetical protein